MSDIFAKVCRLLEYENKKPFESLESPIKDWTQATWLSYLSTREDIPSVHTLEELRQAFQNDAPLIATIYRREIIREHRELKGRKDNPGKQRAIEESFSIDTRTEELWEEGFEDPKSLIPFESIEDFDSIVHHERFKDMSQDQKDAIKRFIVAWCLVEDGYTLTPKMKMRLFRDRKLTGLPLVLPKGPQSGGKKEETTKMNERDDNVDEKRTVSSQVSDVS